MARRTPEYLYHYTSISNLVLILSTGQILFSRLDLVNDPEEGQTADLPLASQHVFVSCWTAEKRESIPMWSLYAPDMRGCRIRLPANFLAAGPPLIHGGLTRRELDPHLEVRLGDADFPITVRHVDGPIKVRYTEDDMHLYPTVRHLQMGDRGVQQVIVPGTLGTVKRRAWQFESEWRYRIVARLENLREPVELETKEKPADFSSLHTLPIRTRALLPRLRSVTLEKLEITMGPAAGAADWQIVHLAAERYAPKAKVVTSAVSFRTPEAH